MYENYQVVDDLGAEKALLQLKEKKEECERLVSICDGIIGEYQAKKEQLQEKYQKELEYVSSILEGYFESCETKSTKTQRKYVLPSANLIKKNVTTRIKAKDTLIDKVSDEFIEISRNLKWGEFKKTLKVIEGIAHDIDTGEIIEDVEIEEVGEKFEIKYT